MHPVSHRTTRRAPRAASVAAAVLLATTAAITPALGATPVQVSAGDASSLVGNLVSVPEERSNAERNPEHVSPPGDVVRLESSATVQEGVTTSARKPQIVKRSARLWMDGVGGSYPPDEQDVSVVEVTQDVSAKRIVIDASYYAAPTASLNSTVSVYFGAWDTKTKKCEAKVWALATGYGTAEDAAFVNLKGNPVGTATRSLTGSDLRITLGGNAAADKGYDCVYAYLDKILSGNEVEAVGSTGAEDFEAEMERAPSFDFYAPKLNAAYPGKWNKIRITVRNDGDLVAKKVRLKLSGKNLTFKKKTLKVGKIKPGKSKDVTARVKLKGKKTRTLKAKATANGGWKATTKLKVGHRPHPTKVKNLNGRTYWAHFTGTSASQNIWQVRGLHFVNKKWVYVGNRPEGSSPKCSAKIKECFRYNYNRSNGTVRIGKIRGKVNSEGIQITKAPKKFSDLRKLFFTPLAKPKKNAKLKVKLAYYDGSGLCTPWSCRSWWRHIELKKNGSFTWTRGQITTVASTTFASSGPDYEGKYKILSKGRIRFIFVHPETGKRTRETHTIGIDANALGKHKPKHGLLIGAMPHT